MCARWLAVGAAVLALAGCGASHTGVVMNISDLGDQPDTTVSHGWVLVVPDSDSARLWEVLRGDPTPPEWTGFGGSPANTISGWSELGAVALVGKGGGFDVAIGSGVYWVCYGFVADDVSALRVDGCGYGDVVPGEIEIRLVQGEVKLSQR